MIGFYLADELRHCPRHWQNFIYSNRDIKGVSIKRLNRLLEPYGARYVPANSAEPDAVIFEQEVGLTLFYLRWS